MRVNPAGNPYVAGAPLRGEEGFFGRQDTLDWVAHELRNPATNALVLYGQRRIGKTTLLLQLRRTLPTTDFLPIYFDLQDQAANPLAEVLADLAETIADCANLKLPSPDKLDAQGRFFRRGFLPRLYQALGDNCRPVFLLDEFDVMDPVAATKLSQAATARALLPFLRQVMNEDPKPAFVFVVGRRAEDFSLDFVATFKASLVREIWVLDQSSAKALVRQAEANGTLHFTNEAVARVLSLTSCHPYLTQLLCQRIWERAYTGNPTTIPSVDVPEVESTVPDALEAGDQALAWLWSGLSPAEKIYVAALAGVADEGDTILEGRVIEVLTEHAARLRIREVELAPQDLVKRRVLVEAGDREYRFAVELFCRWVRENRRLGDVKNELDRMEPFADRLYEIGNEYFSRGQWKDAARYFRDALEGNPRHFRARLHLGEALLALNQTDEAVNELEQAYELDRDEAFYPLIRALVAQAQAREETGDDEGALAIYRQVQRISPNERIAQDRRAAIWKRRGDAALGRNDFPVALAAYGETGDAERVIQQVLEALETEAQAHEQLERWAEAIEVLEKIARIGRNPENAKIRLEQARAHLRLQDLHGQAMNHLREKAWAQAIEIFKVILQEDPDYRDAAHGLKEAQENERKPADLYERGVDLLGRQSWKEAADAFAELIRIDPTYKEDVWQKLEEASREARKLEDNGRLYDAGKFYFEKKQWKAAIGYLKRIVDSGEQYKDAAALLGEANEQLRLQTLYAEAEAQFKAEKWAEAIKMLEEIVHTDRDYRDSRAKLKDARTQYRLQITYEQAMGYLSEEEWPQAIKGLKAIFEEKPDYRDAADKLQEAQKQQELGELYSAAVGAQETGHWEKAIDGFREIIHRVGVYRNVADRLAQVHRQQELDRQFRLGENYSRQKQWKKAEEEFARVHAVDPNYRGVQVRLEEARRQLHLEGLRERGEASLRAENWQEAIGAFEELHGLAPLDTSAIAKLVEGKKQLRLQESYNEGMKYFERKKWGRARVALEKVVSLDPGYRDAAAKLEIAQERSRRSKRVAEALRDPVWQGIGGLVAVIALIVAVYPFVKDTLVNSATPTPRPGELCNGTFDNRLECWEHEGELKQSVKCEGVQCYAVLGSPDYKCEGEVPMGEAWIRQPFQVPQTISPTLSLRYRVFSQDVYVNDSFQVQINDDLVGQFGNRLWSLPSCDREPWDSDWEAVEFDLSNYKGQNVEVLLSNVNGKYEWWNTWTYVDDVQVHETPVSSP